MCIRIRVDRQPYAYALFSPLLFSRSCTYLCAFTAAVKINWLLSLDSQVA